jgi:hypothetical protein
VLRILNPQIKYVLVIQIIGKDRRPEVFWGGGALLASLVHISLFVCLLSPYCLTIQVNEPLFNSDIFVLACPYVVWWLIVLLWVGLLDTNSTSGTLVPLVPVRQRVVLPFLYVLVTIRLWCVLVIFIRLVLLSLGSSTAPLTGYLHNAGIMWIWVVWFKMLLVRPIWSCLSCYAWGVLIFYLGWFCVALCTCTYPICLKQWWIVWLYQSLVQPWACVVPCWFCVLLDCCLLF